MSLEVKQSSRAHGWIGIAMWAKHLEKCSKPFQKQMIHSASFPLLICNDCCKQTWLSLASWA
jgi:hypothetical protein